MASAIPRTKPYEFEQRFGTRRRDRASAVAQARVLAARVEYPVSEDACPPEDLVRFAQHVILNVEWYEKALVRTKGWRLKWIALFIALLVGAFALFAALVFGDLDGPSRSPMAEFAAVLAGFIGLLKLLAQMGDSTRRMAGFHKARSELKQLLYSLENSWRGKAGAEEGLAPAFVNALGAALATAREILDREQAEFFNGLASPPALFDALSNTTERVNAKVDAILDARRQHNRRLHRQHALDDALTARAQEVSARRALDAALEIDPPDPAKIKEAQRTLLRAERARMASEALLEKIDSV
jgi:hypothetical protein